MNQSFLSGLEGMAGTTRLELATSAVTGRRSDQLNYAPASLNQQQTGVSARISNAKSASRHSEVNDEKRVSQD